MKSLKIVLLAIFHTAMPKEIKHKFYFYLTPLEHLAVGTMMTKIKYWRHFIIKRKMDKTIYFKSSKYPYP